MGICPQCRQPVRAWAILFPSSLGGVDCPHCHASLEADVRSRVLLCVLTAGTVLAVHFLLGEARPVWVRVPVELGAALVVSLALAPRISRLRQKRSSVPSLRQGRSSGGF